MYLKKDDINKVDRFIGENLGSVIPGGNNPLSTLSGENRWRTTARSRTTPVSRRSASSSLTPSSSASARATRTTRRSNVSGFVVATGDRLQPERSAAERHDRRSAPHADRRHRQSEPAACVAPNQWIFSAGTGFATDYSKSWSDHAAATLDWKVTDTLFTYVTVRPG